MGPGGWQNRPETSGTGLHLQRFWENQFMHIMLSYFKRTTPFQCEGNEICYVHLLVAPDISDALYEVSRRGIDHDEASG